MLAILWAGIEEAVIVGIGLVAVVPVLQEAIAGCDVERPEIA